MDSMNIKKSVFLRTTCNSSCTTLLAKTAKKNLHSCFGYEDNKLRDAETFRARTEYGIIEK